MATTIPPFASPRMRIIRFRRKEKLSANIHIHSHAGRVVHANGKSVFLLRRRGYWTHINPFNIKLYTHALKSNADVEKVLPASCSAAASYALDLNWDCQPGRRTPDAPHSHKGRGFCYHINSICRQHRTCEEI